MASSEIYGLCCCLTQIFDTPGFPDEPVEERWKRLESQFPTAFIHQDSQMQAGPYFVEQRLCRDRNHMDIILKDVLQNGGEGYVLCIHVSVMLRKPLSYYERQRSATLMKWKPKLEGEARVVGYEEGKNSAEGLVGSLICETLTEPVRRFKIGSGLTETLRREPPTIGSLVSFEYGSLGSQGLPRFPRYRGIRTDL